MCIGLLCVVRTRSYIFYDFSVTFLIIVSQLDVHSCAKESLADGSFLLQIFVLHIPSSNVSVCDFSLYSNVPLWILMENCLEKLDL